MASYGSNGYYNYTVTKNSTNIQPTYGSSIVTGYIFEIDVEENDTLYFKAYSGTNDTLGRNLAGCCSASACLISFNDISTLEK